MATETPIPLTKVDSAIGDLASSPPSKKKIAHRRTSSSTTDVHNITDLGITFPPPL